MLSPPYCARAGLSARTGRIGLLSIFICASALSFELLNLASIAMAILTIADVIGVVIGIISIFLPLSPSILKLS